MRTIRDIRATVMRFLDLVIALLEHEFFVVRFSFLVELFALLVVVVAVVLGRDPPLVAVFDAMWERGCGVR